MARARVADGLLNLALAGAGLAVLALLYGLAARTFVPRAATPAAAGPLGEIAGDIIQVEVLNGAGVPNIARDAALYLRRRALGFDATVGGNHAATERTLVLDRVADPARAQRVATALGLPAGSVRTEADPARRQDVSVVLGADYAALRPFADAEATPSH